MTSYSEYDKSKYVNGFKKGHLTLAEYCRYMNLSIEDMKQWLKESRELPAFGKIKVSEVMKEDTTLGAVIDTEAKLPSTTPIKFESDNIKIELKPNYDKEILKKIIEVFVKC